MRILFVTATYLPTVNGVTYHISSTASALRKMGHKVIIFAPSFPGYQDSDKDVIRYPSLPNPFVKNYPLGIPLILSKKIEKLKPDIIHTHHPLIIGQYASQLAEKLSLPLYFTAHTQYEQYLNYYFPKGYNLTSKILIRNLINISKSCRKVICPSEKTKQRLQKYHIENCVVIYNGIEKSFFVKPKKKNLDQPTLVYTGRIEKEKNPLFLIKIARELKKILPNFRLIILGSGSQLNILNQKIFKYKLMENVLLAGEVNRNILPDIYKSAHLFVTASKSEVMPLSVIEALASGLPILVLNNSGLDEIVKDGKNGFILRESPKLFAEKINFIFSSPQTIYKLSENAYKTAQEFSCEKTARKMIELYSKG